MNCWLRLYTGILDDPKVQRLQPEQFKGWINLLCLAKEDDGLLPSIGDIAFRLRITEADAETLVEALVRRGLLDSDGETLKPHNWNGRQFLSDQDPTAAIRARRYRHNKRNVTDSVTRDDTEASHPPETEQSRAETEQSRGARVTPRPHSRSNFVGDEEFLEELRTNPKYAALDVQRVFQKMLDWCQRNGKEPTRSRLVRWLNREDPALNAKGNGAAPDERPPLVTAPPEYRPSRRKGNA